MRTNIPSTIISLSKNYREPIAILFILILRKCSVLVIFTLCGSLVNLNQLMQATSALIKQDILANMIVLFTAVFVKLSASVERWVF